jgi:hypothetical protein
MTQLVELGALNLNIKQPSKHMVMSQAVVA